ncbi:mucin-2-like [Rhinoderma darwinii]|uniref:mucin-2-like n=1 Tax=Rhinoderma darwinii TaxID=43563 RepID=UPI003F6798BD
MAYRAASLWVFCLALGFSRTIDVIPGRIHNHGHYVCSTWGNYHFKTFDGGFYQFPGFCSYNLASHCRDAYQEFSVHVHRSLVNGHPFIDKITITIKDVTVKMKSNLVVVNGAIVMTPFYSFGILIHKNDAYIKMNTKAGLTLMWNKEDAVMLELDPRFNNHTCGLCGDYNGDPRNNEFVSEDKTLSSTYFGNQQNVNDPNEACKDTEDTEAMNPAHCSKYRSVCEELLGHAAFSDCMAFLNLEAYMEACMLDMCSCDQSQDSFCLCSTITEYSRQCSHAGGRPGNWRTQNFCPKPCPANMIYQESSSPCKSSCSHLEVHSLCEEHYMDGCFCPEGTVQDDHTDRGCVPVTECHCKLQGKLYAPGESIQNDCDKCLCFAGRWNCTDLPCPKVCSIEGGAHFTTFDGKMYTLHGNCYYVLYKARRSRESRAHLILGKLIPCSSSERETCLQSVIFLTDNLKSVAVFKADGRVLLNDLKITLPHVTASFSILQPSDSYVIVQTTYGLQMQIQLLPKMQLYISMEKDSRKQLEGLCGNFNSKEGDDFTTSGGLVEATASAFANTWKALAACHDISDWLDDPCSVSIENKNYADYWCSKLGNEESPFARCHSTIDPTEYAKRCRYDSCNCKDSEHCMCAALSSYVRACASKGIILWGWKNGICDKDITSCPSSQIYLYNLTTCQLTCRSLAEAVKTCASVFTPVDGCGCPDGQYLNEKEQCVPISKCSCYYHDTYLKPQETMTTKDKQCICQNGKLVCIDQINKTCPGEKVYFDCNKSKSMGSGAPIRRSCKTLSIEYFQTECISGCVCPNGLLDDGTGGCAPEDRCPCVHNEDIFAHGTRVKVDCNTCLCQRGRWTCTNTICHGTCTIYGNGHYISFDNKMYDFDGNCEFVAAQDYCETDNSGGSFSVLTENIPCGTTGVTCSKSVKVFLGNTMLKLSEKHVVKTVGEGGKRVDYLTREVGIYWVIEASNGILLIWDKKTTIFIKVSPAYKGKLCGLCGNFDDNSQNDFKTRHMIQVIDALEFGNSWKVDATCPDATDVVNPCSQNPHRHSWAEKQCGLIKSQAFKICHSKVDPKPFYEACVHDACSCDSGGDCECFCTAVGAYAQECTKAEACVYWRTPDVCPIFCDYYNLKGECEWHYHPCGNHSVQTCRSINNIYTNVTITYLEGCYPTCPKDKPIFDEANKKCVTKEECGCYYNDVHYKSGAEVPHYMKCHKCVCSSNENIDCEKLEVSTCSSTTPITTTSITSATITPTTVPEACVYEKVCRWTEWFDVSKPGNDLNSGDYETYDDIRKHHKFCDVPEQIQCRAANAPDTNLDDLKQVVHCNVSYGLICRNSEQKPLWQKCFNYEIRVDCCQWICLVSNPLTTAPIVTTIPEPTIRTTGSTTLSSSVTSELTTPADCPPVCSWSEWFSVSYPSFASGGDYETYDNIRKAGYDVCGSPLHISCRAKPWPNKKIYNLGQNVICDVSYGLVCNNKEQHTLPMCLDYEIRVYCCKVSDDCSFTTPKTSEAKRTTPPASINTIINTIETTTQPILISTHPTTTKFTTETMLTSNITPLQTTSTPTPAFMSQTSTKPQNCTPICSWSEWFSVSYPTYGTGGDYETYHNIRQGGYDVCERPLNISCRARHWPNKALHELRQNVACEVSYGLICNNKDQDSVPVCFDYEIRVYCCRVPDICLQTTPQSSAHNSGTPMITTIGSTGTNATATWTSTNSTNYIETSNATAIKGHSPPTHVTTAPTTFFDNTHTHKGMHSLEANLHSTETRIKASTIIYTGSVSSSTSTEAPFTTFISSPTTTTITIGPSPPPATTSYIPPTTSTTISTATSNESTVIYTPQKMMTTEGSLTNSTTSTSKITSKNTSTEPVLASSTTSSTTTPILSVTRILLTTTERSPNLTTTSATSSPTTNIMLTSTASLASTTTSKGIYIPTKSMPITTETTATGSTNTSPYTTSEATIINKHSETTSTTESTTTSSTMSPTATSNIPTISTPTESMQTSATQVATATTNSSPAITTTTSKTTSIFIPMTTSTTTINSSTTESLDKTIVTASESVPASTTFTTNSTTIFPITSKTTKVYRTTEFIETSPTKSTPSSTPKAIISSSTTSHILSKSTIYTHEIPESPSKATTRSNTTTIIPTTSASNVTTKYKSTKARSYMTTEPTVTTATTKSTESYGSLTPIPSTPSKTIPTSQLTSKVTTEATSTGISSSMSHMPHTISVPSTTESTTKTTIPSLTEIITSYVTATTTGQQKTTKSETSTVHATSEESSTTSSVITSSPKSSTVKETSISSSTMCVCVYNGTPYPPGEIISKVTAETWCHTVICSMECKTEVNNWLCSTSSPASTSIPTLNTTSDISPNLTSTSPKMTSTMYTTAHIHTSSKVTTAMVTSTTERLGCSFEQFREPNETWMLNNCTRAKCLENHTVEIIELKCESPPAITCVNGYPPIAVPDDDQCCWHWECDCVCSGWGDPHYKTFDGTYYSFQGNCTYTLVEEIEKKNNFTIYIDNYNCGIEDWVSCPRNIIVLHNTQEIQLGISGLEDTNIQVVVNGEIVGTPYKKNGVKVYTLGIYYVLEIPELGANITYNGLAFYIKLPYHRFGHNTQGQCGTCTNNRSDDCRTRGGDIVSKCDIMADSWIVEDVKKPECVQIKTTVPPPTSSTCQPSTLCSFIMGPTFQKCHKIVSPNDYYEACVYDSCHVSRSTIGCSSLQHYAQLCGDKGICIDWRSQVPECSMSCPSHKMYNACGSAIPRTCQITPEDNSLMKDERLVEGCFCPQGTIRFSPAVDICVHTCGCVGPDNNPRKFGEKFQFDCQDCVCREGGSGIICQKHKCKEMTDVQCTLEGVYPEIQVSPTDPCCKETVCKCDRSRCETISPTCQLGYEAVGSIPDGHCCSHYKCIPKNVCVHGNAEYMPGAPVYSDNCQSCVCAESANSTAGPKITCTDIPYNVQCPLGFALKKSTQHCCGECEQTHCVLSLNGSNTSYHLMQPGEMIPSENNCTLYSCTVIRNKFIISMSQISCPHFNEDECEPETIEFLSNGCCKVCIKKLTSCRLYEYYDYLSYNNCRTTDLVKMSRCNGSCETFSIYSSSTKAMSHKCVCCQEAQTSQKRVILQCSDRSQVEHEYIAVERCDCMNTQCEPGKLSEESTTDPSIHNKNSNLP